MSNSLGKSIKIQIFGQSHSDAIGVVIDGLPAGVELDMERINAFLARRRGGGQLSTARAEKDEPKILSGVVNGVTCMAPLCAVFENADTRSADYDSIRRAPRPSHADLTAHIKSGGFNDVRGGGAFSGRLTLPLCFAGAICKQILEARGVRVGAHISSIADIRDVRLDPVSPSLDSIPTDFPVIDRDAAERMRECILSAKADGDSVGGTIECAVTGIPAGIGEPMFDGLENSLARALFAIPAIKGVEFGSGFDCAAMRGSEHNDPIAMCDGRIVTTTNNAGGITGGISNGMPIIVRVAVKPTPSIAKEQLTVDLVSGENTRLTIHGRHDPCIVPRAVAVVEAAVAFTILDEMLSN